MASGLGESNKCTEFSSQPVANRQQLNRLSQHWVHVSVHLICELRAGMLQESLGDCGRHASLRE